MQKELICSITVTFRLLWEDNSVTKKTIRKFVFDNENDKGSEIKKFVYNSLKISEIEKYSEFGHPKRKYTTLAIENEYGCCREISCLDIDYVIENEWSE